MPASVALIADDLTGALDSVEPFARAGLSAAVAVDIAGVAETLARGCEVVAINTDSRALSPAAARERVRAAWIALASRAPRIVVKKIDSRLKGNVTAEIETLARCSGRTEAVICPALPDAGRLIVGGRLAGFGIAEPIDIAGRLGGLNLPFSIPDCTGSASMADAAEAMLESPATILPVGARGLAQALAGALTRRMTAPPIRLDAWRTSAPMLMVIGSRDPITAAQLDALAAERPDTVLLPAPDGVPAPTGIGRRADLIVIHATEGAAPSSPERVASRLAETAAMLARAHGIRTILGCGGDTSLAVARALGIACLVPVGEALPGAPISVGEGRDGRFVLLAKSGGLGDSDALVRIAAQAGALPLSFREKVQE